MNEDKPKKHPGGRPRTVCPPPEELADLGEEMVEWVTLNDPLHISAWYSVEKRFTESTWDSMIAKPEFLSYYEIAKRIIGQKYLDKNSNVREGISQRWQRAYFRDLRKLEDEDLAYKADLADKISQKSDAKITPQQALEAINLIKKTEIQCSKT